MRRRITLLSHADKGQGGLSRIAFPSQSLVASDLDSFRRQESILIALNLLILIVLFSLHLYFASFWGRTTPLLFLGVSFGIIAKGTEWLWWRGLKRALTA